MDMSNLENKPDVTKNKKLVHSHIYVEPVNIPGGEAFSLRNPSHKGRTRKDYINEISLCRHFYKNDAIANAVVNRIIDISISSIYHRKENCTEEEMTFFNAILNSILEILPQISLSFLVDGMAIVDIIPKRVVGSTIHQKLGKRRIYFPKTFILRNSAHIILKADPMSAERIIFFEIPPEEVYFIEHKGMYYDGTKNESLYILLEQQFPEYVKMVQNGVRIFRLDQAFPIFRKLMPFDEWPQPYLSAAIPHIAHKARIKEMDYNLATRALEAVRLVKAGNDQYPVTEDDNTLEQIASQLQSRPGANVYNLFANHTVQIEWVYPPLETLLSKDKYESPNDDIFLALGFSRSLLIGEAIRSNTSASSITSLGPISIIQNLRDSIIKWLKDIYTTFKESNNFKNYPNPYFKPIRTADLINLLAFVLKAVDTNILSKNTAASFFGAYFEEEQEQIRNEQKENVQQNEEQNPEPNEQTEQNQGLTQSENFITAISENADVPADVPDE